VGGVSLCQFGLAGFAGTSRATLAERITAPGRFWPLGPFGVPLFESSSFLTGVRLILVYRFLDHFLLLGGDPRTQEYENGAPGGLHDNHTNEDRLAEMHPRIIRGP
jgi:hypothetical protein